VAFTILGLLILLPFPELTRRAVERVSHAPAQSLGIGLLLLVAVPVGALTLTLIGMLAGGWWIGMALCFIVLFLSTIGVSVSAMGIGRWISARLNAGTSMVLALIFGILLLGLVALIPVLGSLVMALVLMAGFGALATVARGAMSSARASASPAGGGPAVMGGA
jgi:hypothetical protein